MQNCRKSIPSVAVFTNCFNQIEIENVFPVAMSVMF